MSEEPTRDKPDEPPVVQPTEIGGVALSDEKKAELTTLNDDPTHPRGNEDMAHVMASEGDSAEWLALKKREEAVREAARGNEKGAEIASTAAEGYKELANENEEHARAEYLEAHPELSHEGSQAGESATGEPDKVGGEILEHPGVGEPDKGEIVPRQTPGELYGGYVGYDMSTDGEGRRYPREREPSTRIDDVSKAEVVSRAAWPTRSDAAEKRAGAFAADKGNDFDRGDILSHTADQRDARASQLEDAEAARYDKLQSEGENPERLAEEARRVAEATVVQETMIANLRNLGTENPGIAQAIDTLETAKNEISEHVKKTHEAEQAVTNEQESVRLEKVKGIKARIVDEVTEFITERIVRRPGGTSTGILKFNYVEDGGRIFEEHDPWEREFERDSWLESGLERSGEEWDKWSEQNPPTATEVRPEEVDEMIDLVYRALGTKRPDVQDFKVYNDSRTPVVDGHPVEDQIEVRYSGQALTDSNIPHIEIFESWKKNPKGSMSKDAAASIGVDNVPITRRRVDISLKPERRRGTEE